MRKKVIIGMSGGVDSSVAAHLLIKQGYEVEGLFMRNWDSAVNKDVLGNPDLDAPVCPQELDYQDAKKVCEKLEIPLHRVDFVKEYWDDVFTYFLNEYKAGRTPNPDVMCNKYIKFNAFLKHAVNLGADYIAMGHYAGVRHDETGSMLLKGKDSNKDQSYFLCMLTSDQLSKTIFPLYEIDKPKVREIAIDLDLATARKKDSTGVCFIGERNFTQFLSNYLPAQPGDMVNDEGEVVGKHIGLMYYTIGQRKGLGIGGAGDAYYVTGKDLEKNILHVGQGFHHEKLYSTSALITDVNWVGAKPTEENYKCFAKFRYRQADNGVSITWIDETSLMVTFDEPLRAVTPGQVAAFYDDEVCLGGGIITTVFNNGEKRMY